MNPTVETPVEKEPKVIFDQAYLAKLYNAMTDLVLRTDPKIRREFQEAGILIYKTDN